MSSKNIRKCNPTFCIFVEEYLFCHCTTHGSKLASLNVILRLFADPCLVWYVFQTANAGSGALSNCFSYRTAQAMRVALSVANPGSSAQNEISIFRFPTLLTASRHHINRACCICLLTSAVPAFAAPTLSGQPGYVNMPNALVDPDGTFSMGYSFDEPYGALWLSTAILPSLQVSGRFISINGTPGFTNVEGEYGFEYGRFKDKVVDAKLRLWSEGRWMPGVAIGATDLLGTELFKGQYIVATKTFGPTRNVEVSLGYGRNRPDGAFAGARWRPAAAPAWAVVAEYDANDYPKDFRANVTDAGKRSKGPSLGLEYRWGWLGAQVARHRDHFSANVYAQIPLSLKEFIPKVTEPAYFKAGSAPMRASAASWQEDGAPAAALVQALARQDYKNIRVEYSRGVLRVSLTNSRISEMGRAVGRAARTVLAFAPLETRAIHVTYTKSEQPFATYEFLDLPALSDYLTGLLPRERFLSTVEMRYADRQDRLDDDGATMAAGIKDEPGLAVQVAHDGHAVQISSQDREANRFRITPKMGFFFNDPSGALRYELAAASNYDKRLGNGLYLNGAVRLNVVENITGVDQESNSVLPHVRTDIAEYKRGGRFKLQKLMLNQYLNPAERVYARISGGLYEEMFRGVGGQVLYLPKDASWAADMSVDLLQQRGYKGWFDVRDYKTVTAIGALHYRMPYDITLTARAGRFLAKDNGVRMEFKRRFRSGVEVGAWYTKTDGKDITNPGTLSKPYNDKGIFLSIPLNSMLPSDSQANAGFSLAPWTRDVGQMVASPGDLYEMFEAPQRDFKSYDGLGNFGERPDEAHLDAITQPVRGPASPWPGFRLRLEQSAGAVKVPNWAYGSAVAAGAVLGSALLDKPVDKFMVKHQDGRAVRHWGEFGKNMPVALAAAVGAAALLGDDRMQNMGIISLQSIAGAVGVTAVGKYAINRARPEMNLGASDRSGNGYSRANSSFPSGHSAVAFAAVTPFAQEFDAPWLYGVAAFTSLGRTANRKHWVSDTVAGGVVGYAVGSMLWKAQRDNTPSRLSIMPGPKEISVAWQTTY